MEADMSDLNDEAAIAQCRAVGQRSVLVMCLSCRGEALLENFKKRGVFEGGRDTFLVVQLLVH